LKQGKRQKFKGKRAGIREKGTLNLNTILKKQSQFAEGQMNVTSLHTRKYEKTWRFLAGQKKANESQLPAFGRKLEAPLLSQG
jgi:hypothetical protein